MKAAFLLRLALSLTAAFVVAPLQSAEPPLEIRRRTHELLAPILDVVNKQMQERRVVFTDDGLRAWNERVAFAGWAVSAEPERAKGAVEFMPEMVARMAELGELRGNVRRVDAKAVDQILGEPERVKPGGCRYWPFCKWW